MATNPDDLIAAYTPKCAGFEGTVPWMYLDTRGNVTAAIGLMLADAKAALALPWWSPGLSRRATESEVSSEFARVSILKPGFGPNAYRNDALSPLLKGTDIDAMLGMELRGFIAELVAAFPVFWTWPQPAQLAALDMIYNLGATKLLGGEFPAWKAAAEREDWPVCAEQCERGGIGLSRNEWTEGQFNAASMEQVTA